MTKGQPLLETLYEALRSPMGISLSTNDPARLRQRLYAERRKADDPTLDQLSFVESPFDPAGHLWIVKRGEDDV